MTAVSMLKGPSFDPAIGKRVRVDKQLTEALLALGEGKGMMVMHMQKPWASITFSGVRHSFDLVFHGEEGIAAGNRLIELLPEHEFTIPGQLVADAAVTEVCEETCPPQLTLICELLLLEES